MIILTGGAGFIGTNILHELNERGINDILVIDNIEGSTKGDNIEGAKYRKYINKNYFWDWYEKNKNLNIESIIHLGACSNTAETDLNYLYENNVLYSQKLWNLAKENHIPFIYASSAATYGDGSLGFHDDHVLIHKYLPLNPYGQSKQDFDLWVLKQKETPPLWIGLKYFNVYGPFETHKGSMASVVLHGYNQIQNHAVIKLFKSYKIEYKHGEQVRDFIYVKDVVKMTLSYLKNKVRSGIYNIGTGKSRSFNDLAHGIFKAINKNISIEYIPMPEELRAKYQYRTCAIMEKARGNNILTFEPTELEVGIRSYVENIIGIS